MTEATPGPTATGATPPATTPPDPVAARPRAKKAPAKRAGTSTALAERSTAPAAEKRAQPPGRPEGPPVLTLRIPFVTITIGPQPVAPVATEGPPTANARGTLEKVAFYGGVATMGALGVIEWPVAAAVAAGTWVAQHTLPGRRPPAPAGTPQRSGETGAERSAEPAGSRS